MACLSAILTNTVFVCLCICAFVFVYLQVRHPGTLFLRSLYHHLSENISFVWSKTSLLSGRVDPPFSCPLTNGRTNEGNPRGPRGPKKKTKKKRREASEAPGNSCGKKSNMCSPFFWRLACQCFLWKPVVGTNDGCWLTSVGCQIIRGAGSNHF